MTDNPNPQDLHPCALAGCRYFGRLNGTHGMPMCHHPELKPPCMTGVGLPSAARHERCKVMTADPEAGFGIKQEG